LTELVVERVVIFIVKDPGIDRRSKGSRRVTDALRESLHGNSEVGYFASESCHARHPTSQKDGGKD
jgi:hypothetical protein